jgi:large subunit ribosomal protein L22
MLTQARARVRYLKMSPRKMRRVIDLVKGRPVQDALNILNYTPKSAAHQLAKTVKAAAANAIAGVGTAKLKAEDLMISRVFVDSAPTGKRARFQSMGRVFRVRKRYCHVTVEVQGEAEVEKARGKRGKAEKASEETKKVESKADSEKEEVKEEVVPGDSAEETTETAEESEADSEEETE